MDHSHALTNPGGLWHACAPIGSNARKFMASSSIWQRIGNGITTAREVTLNLLFLLIAALILTSLLSRCSGVSVADRTALLIAPEGQVVEQASSDLSLEALLSGGRRGQEVLISDLLSAIERAREDNRIRAIVLDLHQLTQLSAVHADALTRMLKNFQSAGKQVLAYGDFFTQQQYRLASAADALYLHPQGMVLFDGAGSYSLYFKELLDRLKVNMHVFRAGRYKSAVEPFTETGMSDAAREESRELVDGLWQDYVTTITSGRKLPDDAFTAFTSNIDQRVADADGSIAVATLEAGLVDELLTPDAFNARVADLAGADAHGKFNAVSVADYLAATSGAGSPAGEGNIALIRMSGPIFPRVDGEQVIDADEMTALIRRAREDDGIRAIVVRIDSPGGSSFHSELIRKELELAQVTGKPVVVSMATMAASGGYWIAATADAIYAYPQTITGSIGVFSVFPSFADSLAEIGIRSDGVGTTPLSTLRNPFGDPGAPFTRIMQANVDRLYGDFVNLVSRGRNLPLDRVREIAEGRVWLGARAQEIGLVDAIGGLDDAVNRAAELTGLKAWKVREFTPPVDARMALLRSLAESSLGTQLNSLLASRPPPAFLPSGAFGHWKTLSRLLAPAQHPMALCTACLALP
ncbi:MAG: signal peptide peptidase SppA [Pseudomonadales bacterium]